MSRKSGYIVKTKKGKLGKVYHDSEPVNGKIPVHLDNGGKLLCSEENLNQIGFFD